MSSHGRNPQWVRNSSTPFLPSSRPTTVTRHSTKADHSPQMDSGHRCTPCKSSGFVRTQQHTIVHQSSSCAAAEIVLMAAIAHASNLRLAREPQLYKTRPCNTECEE